MTTYQIHDGTFDVALYDRDCPREALLDFFADRRRGELRSRVTVHEDGSATIVVDGVTYRAAPFSLPSGPAGPPVSTTAAS